VHKISALLLLILLIGFTGCEEKDQDDTLVGVENTTELSTNNKATKRNYTDHNLTQESTAFTLLDTQSQNQKVTVSGQEVIFEQKKHPIVILNFFATWCRPCIGEIAYLNDLQKKYQNNVFVAGILTNDTIELEPLQTFIHAHTIHYSIYNASNNDEFARLVAGTLGLLENFPIPLIVIYVEGIYFTHYEGSVPVEMIEYDIEQAQKILKSRQ
jgi:thiol-disulfide isomerase/thioredoxin